MSQESEYDEEISEERTMYKPTGFENFCFTVNGEKYYIDFNSNTRNSNNVYYNMYRRLSQFVAPTAVFMMNTETMATETIVASVFAYYFSDMAIPVMSLTYLGNYVYNNILV